MDTMVAMVTVGSFPWLVQIGCGCQFSRIELSTGETVQHWNPCGPHVVAAATGYQPHGWPPRVEPSADREPAAFA